MQEETTDNSTPGRRDGQYFDGYRWRSVDGSDEPEKESKDSKSAPMAYELSEREHEILHMMASKMTAKQIGDKLHISPRTVQFHQLNLYWKLGISGRDSRSLAVDKGRKLGLIK